MQSFNFFGNTEPSNAFVKNSDGSITITGHSGNTYNADLSTAAPNASNPEGWQGIAFGGGSQTDYQNVLNAGYPIMLSEYTSPVLNGNSGYTFLKSAHVGYVMLGNDYFASYDLSYYITHAPWDNNRWGSNGRVGW